MANPRPDLRRPNKDRVMSVRLDEVETNLLITEAVLEDVAPSALLRRLAMDEVRRRAAARTGGDAPAAPLGTAGAEIGAADVSGAVAPASPQAMVAPPKELAALRTEVNKAGVNVNQIARLGNATRSFVVAVVEQTRKGDGSVTTKPAGDDDVRQSFEAFVELRDALMRVEELLGGVRRAR